MLPGVAKLPTAVGASIVHYISCPLLTHKVDYWKKGACLILSLQKGEEYIGKTLENVEGYVKQKQNTVCKRAVRRAQ